MTDKAREEMSALMDGEASEFEVHHVLKSSEHDDELNASWRRYHMTRSVIRGEMREKGASDFLNIDISQAVSAAISEEPAYQQGAQGEEGKPSLLDRVLRPLGSVAVAASVSAMVIFGWQSTGGFAPQNVGSENTVATHSQPATPPAAVLASNPPPSYATREPSGYAVGSPSNNGYILAGDAGQSAVRSGTIQSQDIIRLSLPEDERFNRYILSHSGNAAFNTISGAMPYARVVTLKPSSDNAK